MTIDQAQRDEFNKVQEALTFLRNQSPRDLAALLRNLETHANEIVSPTFPASGKQRAMGRYLAKRAEMPEEGLPPEVKAKVDIIHAYITQHYAAMMAAVVQRATNGL